MKLKCLRCGHDWAQWLPDACDPTESRVCVRCWRVQERVLELAEVPMPKPPVAEAGRWEPGADDYHPAPRPTADRATADLHAIDDRRTLEDRYLAVYQQLREVTADRDALDTANGRLLARVGLYRGMLTELGVSPRTVAELERADRQWIGHADTAQPVPSRPGLAIDVTRPGDDDDLLIGRPW